MIDWKSLGKKLLFLPLWLIILLAVISAISLVLVFANGMDTHPVAYVVYVISFYSLTVLCVYSVIVLPKQYQYIKQAAYSNRWSHRYLTDAVFRNHISLYKSLGINLLYIAFNIASGVWYHTRWFYILAGYYTILAVMRFLLVRYIRRNEIGKDIYKEWKRARVCACILTLINLSLSAAVLMMMYQNKGFIYHGVMIYIMAMYTFYITTIAIVNLIKYRKHNSPIMMTTKMITLAAALVSVLSLETAMLTAFGADTSIETKRILIAATGAGICAIVTAMSSYMIVRSTKAIQSMNDK